jgi:acetylornithine aminotransferase/acetylornithine/N-succinyldiaminopimelate aminotransferase
VEAALDQFVMLNSVQGNILRFLPSFLLERQHVDVALDLLHGLLKTRRPAEQTVDADSLVAAAV